MADTIKQKRHTPKSKGTVYYWYFRLLVIFPIYILNSKFLLHLILAHFPAACKNEAKWMFGHLDINNDGFLSNTELFDLEHDQNERCIKPFIEDCNLDNNDTLSPREWCRCFEKTDRPCAAIRRRMKTEFNGKMFWYAFLVLQTFYALFLDGYIPDCDIQGFYKSMQCHSLVGVCWCVDKHGVEFANTRTKGKPNCGEIPF